MFRIEIKPNDMTKDWIYDRYPVRLKTYKPCFNLPCTTLWPPQSFHYSPDDTGGSYNVWQNLPSLLVYSLLLVPLTCISYVILEKSVADWSWYKVSLSRHIHCSKLVKVTGPRSACHPAESSLMKIIAWGPQVKYRTRHIMDVNRLKENVLPRSSPIVNLKRSRNSDQNVSQQDLCIIWMICILGQWYNFKVRLWW